MTRRSTGVALIALLLVGGIVPAAGEERSKQEGFKRIRGTAITKLMAGKEFSDGVHWRYSFKPDGALTEYAMTRRRDVRWQVKRDALCWQVHEADGCFEVWTSSTALRLQPLGLGVPLDGSLSRLVP
jgi:hypothetical protein